MTVPKTTSQFIFVIGNDFFMMFLVHVAVCVFDWLWSSVLHNYLYTFKLYITLFFSLLDLKE